MPGLEAHRWLTIEGWRIHVSHGHELPRLTPELLVHRYPDRVLLVSYEAVAAYPKRSMRAVADWLDIDWDPLLLQPTFNRLPTWTNSSFEVAGEGVRREPLQAWKKVVSPETAEEIEAATGELYEQVIAAADIV